MKNATHTAIARLLQATCLSLAFFVIPFFARAQGRVLINEYLPWPNNACGTTAEFIELYNFGPGQVNIGGYIITDGDYAITIPANTILLPGKYFVLAGQAVIPQNCGNDLRNVTVNLNWNTCGCTSAPIPITGDGFITDGGGSNEQVVLLDSNLKIIDAIARSALVEPSSLITTSTVGGQFTARTFDLDDMNIPYETIGESVGRGNSLARRIDGGCGWIKDTQESAGDINNTSGETADWEASLTITGAYTCSNTGSVEVTVSNTQMFPMHYTLAKDLDENFQYDLNDSYTYGSDSTAPSILLTGLEAGRYQLIVESSLGCNLTLFDFTILGCYGLILDQPPPGTTVPARNNNNIVSRIAENPFYGPCTLLLNAPAKGRMQIRIYNTQGRLISTENIQVLRGNNTVILPVPQLLPGMYLLQLRNETGKQVQTIKAIKR